MISRISVLAAAALLAACSTGGAPAPDARTSGAAALGSGIASTRVSGSAVGSGAIEPGSEMIVTVFNLGDAGVPIARSVLGNGPASFPWAFDLPVPGDALAAASQPVVSVTIKNGLGLLAYVSDSPRPAGDGPVSVPVMPVTF